MAPLRFPFLALAALAPFALACGTASTSAPGATPEIDAAAADPGSPDAANETSAADSGSDAPPPGDAGPYYPLGMNDVTILAPLPASKATPVLLRGSDLADDGAALVPHPLFDRITAAASATPVLFADAYDSLHLVAARFELCDRNLPGPCAAGEDGRLRLVFQPIRDDGSAEDVGVHTFYAIPNAELATAVSLLRDLARVQAAPVTSALAPSPALVGGSTDYASKLRAFVLRYGGETKLVRLTLNAQPDFLSAIHWTLRGIEKKGASFVDMTIYATSATSQEIQFNGNASYTPAPAVDAPRGLVDALSQSAFAAAADKAALLGALVAVDNPLTSAPDTVPCIACHASTASLKARADATGIDPSTLPGRYASKYDLSIAAGKSATTDRTLRALGWVGKDPMISQRVANDTAQLLVELEQRFPAP
jgi:hypothetical protein